MMKKLVKTGSALLFVFLLVGCNQQPFNVAVQKQTINKETNDYLLTYESVVFNGLNPKTEDMVNPLNEKLKHLNDSLCNEVVTEAELFFKQYAAEQALLKSDEKKEQAEAILEAEKERAGTDSAAVHNDDKKEITSETGQKPEHSDQLPHFDRPFFKYELYSTDTVYFVSEDFISTLTEVYTFTGGAHGMTTFYAFNYQPKKQKFLTNQEILNYDKADQINELLAEYFDNKAGCFDTEPTLDKVSAINILPDTLRFTFEQYLLGAYACGIAKIDVPVTKLKGLFKTEVKAHKQNAVSVESSKNKSTENQ